MPPKGWRKDAEMAENNDPKPGDVTTLGAAMPVLPRDVVLENIRTKGSLAPAIVALRSKGILDKQKPDIELDVAALEKEKLFPVRMLKDYRPFTSNFQFGEVDPDTGDITYTDPPEVLPGQDAGFIHRIEAGEYAMIPRSEAIQLFKRGIAERNDELNG